MPGYRTVPISELTPGSVLATSIFDTRFAKLLDAGAVIDQHLIERLGTFGITEVMVERAAQQVVKRPKMTLPSGVELRPKECGNGTNSAIDRCSGCGAIISLEPPTPSAEVRTWLCKTCGAIYFGSEDGGADCRGVTRRETDMENAFVARVEVNMQAATSSVPPENVRRLIKTLVPAEYTGPDHRIHKRYPVAVPVVVLPLALDFRIVGEPVQMTTANISLGGAALIHTRFLDAPYLALDFTVAGVELLQVVLKVLRVNSTGPVYEMAGQFISRLSQAPS
jgi:hypothetical protein